MMRSFTERWAASYIDTCPVCSKHTFPVSVNENKGYTKRTFRWPCRESLSQNQQKGQRRAAGKNWGDVHTLLFVSISWHFGESYWPRWWTARVFWCLTKSLFLKLQMIVGKTDGKCADGNGDGKTQGRLHQEEKQQARKKVKTKIWNLNIATSEGHLAIKAEAWWGSPVARTSTPGETAPWETMRRVSKSHSNPSCGPRGKDAWILVTYPNCFVAFCGF